MSDNVTPAGSGVACYALQRLGYLLSEPRYLQAVEKSLNSVWMPLKKYPATHISLLITLKGYLKPPHTVVIRGKKEELQAWQTILIDYYHPSHAIFMIDEKEIDLPQALTEKISINKKVTAYVCFGEKCFPPIFSLNDLIKKIKENHT